MLYNIKNWYDLYNIYINIKYLKIKIQKICNIKN